MKTKRIAPRHTDKGIAIGPRNTSFGREVILVNPTDRDYYGSAFILGFGHCATYLYVHASGLDDALSECAEWIEKHAPGLFCDDAVREAEKEAYDAAIAEGMDEESAREKSWDAGTVDTTSMGDDHYIGSDEWFVALENPSRRELDEFLYDPQLTWKERTHCDAGHYWTTCNVGVNSGGFPEYSFGGREYAVRNLRVDGACCRVYGRVLGFAACLMPPGWYMAWDDTRAIG